MARKSDKDEREVFDRLNNLFRKLQAYPVLSSEKDVESSKDELIKIYKSGSDNVRQYMLYVIHNLLFEIDDIKMPQATNSLQKRERITEGQKLRMGTYQRMFNFNSSLEGIHHVIEMTSRFDHPWAVKVLTHFLSHLLMIEVEGYRALRNDVVDALGNMTDLYALKSLLYYYSVVTFDPLKNRIYDALTLWKDKVNKMKISKKEKKAILDLIHTETDSGEEVPKSQYG